MFIKNKDQKNISDKGPRDISKHELLIAFIKHGSKPIAIIFIGLMILIWLLTFREPIISLFNRTTKLQLGEWIQISADKAGVSDELQQLTTLSPEQIQLFLIVGTKRTDSITYNGPEANLENYKKLENTGLLWNIKIDSISREISWKVTDKAEKLHRLLMDHIIFEIENSKNSIVNK